MTFNYALTHNLLEGSASWEHWLDHLAEFLNLKTVHLLSVNRTTYAVRWHVCGGEQMSHEQFELYLSRYAEHDWAFKLAFDNPTMTLASLTSSGVIAQAKESEFAQAIARKFDVVDVMSTRLYSEGDWEMMLIANTGADQGYLTSDRVAQFSQFLPVISQLCFWQLKSMEPDYRSYLEAILSLQKLPSAIYDKTGTRVCESESFSQLLAEHDVIDANRSLEHFHNKALQRSYVYRIAELARSSGEVYYENTPVMHLDHNSLVVVMTPLTNHSGERLGVLVTALELTMQAKLAQHCANLFSLTPTEVITCQYLLTGAVAKEIAQARDVSIHTVRDQIKSILQKTNCSNQHALTALLISIPANTMQ